MATTSACAVGSQSVRVRLPATAITSPVLTTHVPIGTSSRAQASLAARKASRIERIVGRLRSSLAYLQIEEIMSRDLHSYLQGVMEQCHSLHAALHEVYIDYPIESAFEA